MPTPVARRNRRLALLEAVALLVLMVAAYGIASWLKGRFDADAIRFARRLTGPVEWLLAAACLGTWVVMCVKGPVNPVQRSICRFMFANVLLWTYLAFRQAPRGPVVTVALVAVLMLVATDLVVRTTDRYLGRRWAVGVAVAIGLGCAWGAWRAGG